MVVDEYRSKKGKNQTGLDAIDERMLGYEDTTEEHLDQDQDIAEVYKKLRSIRKEYKEVILLYYIEELSIKEISIVLRKKENTVRVLVHRAMQVLKKQYE